MQRFGWSRLWTTLVVGTLVVGSAALSWAGPLLPPFPGVWNPGQMVAGESTFPVTFGTGEPIQVDWIVAFWGNVGPGGVPVWGYYYQLENMNPITTPEKTIAIFTVATPGPPFFYADFIDDASLDVNFDDIFGPVPGHTATNYPNLGSPPTPEETEPSPGDIKNPTSFDLTLWDVTYYFGPPFSAEIAPGKQSTILFGYAVVPPMYGVATVQNTKVQWAGHVPVPSPEPSTVALLVMGISGVGVFTCWRRKKA